jgi:transposase
MAQAKEASVRLKIVKDRAEGLSYSELSRLYGISYNTVRTICMRHANHGEAGLRTNYSNCGRPIQAPYETSFRLVRLVKYLHPLWGVPMIVARIKERFADLPLQSVRHYQRRLNSTSQRMPPPSLPKSSAPGRVLLPHDEWQIDAKERILFDEGRQEACFLNITDTKTNALLKVKVFPPRQDQSGASRGNPKNDVGDISSMGNA